MDETYYLITYGEISISKMDSQYYFHSIYYKCVDFELSEFKKHLGCESGRSHIAIMSRINVTLKEYLLNTRK